jgi:hypothetical protein
VVCLCRNCCVQSSVCIRVPRQAENTVVRRRLFVRERHGRQEIQSFDGINHHVNMAGFRIHQVRLFSTLGLDLIVIKYQQWCNSFLESIYFGGLWYVCTKAARQAGNTVVRRCLFVRERHGRQQIQSFDGINHHVNMAGFRINQVRLFSKLGLHLIVIKKQ